MSSIAISRVLEFDAGHRVHGHEGKCSNLHGHRYKVVVTVTTPFGTDLDSIGRVKDFSVIKSVIGAWIDHHWDHGLLLNSDDPLVHVLIVKSEIPQKYFLFDKKNPTAEVMAKYLYELCEKKLPDLEMVSVTVFETPNCYATYPVK